MAAITRRRSSRDDEPEEARPTRRRRGADTEDEPEERPSRRRRASDDMPDEERNSPPRRRSRSEEDEPEERPSRRRRGGSRGFSSYEQKKAKSSNYADDFKPGPDNPTLIHFLEPEPFDNYNQHWIEQRDLPRDEKRSSYICLDDEYFADDEDYDKGCPLCAVGEPVKTYSLFNVLDLTNPRKPENKVWTAPPGVAGKLARAAKEKKSSPLDRDDLYFEVELVKSKNKSEWTITPVKARDLQEDYDMEPFDSEELDDFRKDLFEDRSSVTKVDSYEELDDLAEYLSR